MSVADDLRSEAALADTIRPTIVTVSDMFSGPVIWLCSRVEYACASAELPPASTAVAETVVKPNVMKPISE